jgi:hypothetical protein
VIYCHTSEELVEFELEPREALTNAAMAMARIVGVPNIRKKGLVRDEGGMICEAREEKEGEEDKTLLGITRTPGHWATCGR